LATERLRTPRQAAHLTRLRQAGLITSRTQGRAVYYSLTQPELGAMLQAAGQLLAPARPQAAEENDTTVRKTQPPNR
jgi:DNA-binding transcriptional regulator PaaX